MKLNPSLVQAWNTLGHCYWKKGDLKAAQNCFDGALKRVSRPPAPCRCCAHGFVHIVGAGFSEEGGSS